jgi:hypothetical protein
LAFGDKQHKILKTIRFAKHFSFHLQGEYVKMKTAKFAERDNFQHSKRFIAQSQSFILNSNHEENPSASTV